MVKKHKWRIIACFLFTFSVLLMSIPIKIFAQKSNRVYIYDIQESNFPETLINYLKNKPCWEVTSFSLNDTPSLDRFLKIVQILKILGIEFIPTDVCISCIYGHISWNEIWPVYASPLMGFFSEGRLVAITVQVSNCEVLDQVIALNVKDEVKIFTPYEAHSLSDEDVIARLAELFLGQEKTGEVEINVLNLASYVVLLALADSVNPCTFAVFTALLFMALYSLSRKKALTTGLFFILAIFISYYILGLGLLRFLTPVPYIDKVLAFLGLAMGAFSILRGFKPRFKSPVPSSFRRFLEVRLSRSYTSSVASFLLGLITSLTLLPCSSGPYVVSLGLLSAFGESFQAHLLLVLYNILFILPLVGILIAILASKRLANKIKVLRSTRLGVMELINGGLLAAICVYILLS